MTIQCTTMKRDVPNEFPIPSALMTPVSVFIETSEDLKKMSGERRLLLYNEYSNYIAACACLAEFNLFINQEPPKNEVYDHILKINFTNTVTTPKVAKVLLYFFIFSAGIIPSWMSDDLKYESTLYDNNSNEIRKFSSEGDSTTYFQLLLAPAMFTKYWKKPHPITWAIQDLYNSSLISKINDY